MATYVIVTLIVLGLAVWAWRAAGRGRPQTRVDRAARRADADSVAQRERTGMHVTPPPVGG